MGNVKAGKFIDDETGESLNDVEKVLGKLGIKLRDNKDTFKDFGSVLDEIGGKWNGFTKVEQNAISVAISGVRNRENFLVLMNNYGKALEYAGVSANSSGTAMKKFEAYQDSIEAKSKKFTATLEGLSSAFVDSDLVKGILDIGSGALSGLTTFIDKFGTIPTIVSAATLALGLFNKNIGIFQNQNGQFSILGKTVEEMRQAKSEGQSFGGLFTKQVVQPFANAEEVITKYNLGLQHNSLTQKGFQRLLDQSDESLGNYLKNLNGSKATMEGYNKSLNASKVATKALELATTLLNTAISVCILIAINLAIKAISNYINKIDNLKTKVKDSAQAYEDTKSKLEEINSSLDENKKKIAEINANPLDPTQEKTLTDLKNQNLELEKQKQVLEEMSKIKLNALNQSASDLFNTKNSRLAESVDLIKNKQFDKAFNLFTSGNETKNSSFKYGSLGLINPILPVTALIKDATSKTDSLLEETTNSINKIKTLVDTRNEILADGIVTDKEQKKLATINSEYNALNKTITENMQTIQDNKQNLDKTSGTYQAIENIENKYLEMVKRIGNGDISNGITEEFNEAQKKIEGTKTSTFYGNFGEYSSLFDSSDSLTNRFTVKGNAIEQYDKISNIIDVINQKRYSGNKLTQDEQHLYDSLIERQNKLSDIVGNNTTEYIKGLTSQANIQLQNYTKSNPLNDTTNFKEWKDGLLELANGNETLKSILSDLVDQTFPDEIYQVQLMTDADKAFYYQTKQVDSGLEEQTDIIFDLKKALSDTENTQKVLGSAMQEMSENGQISAETYQALIDLGDNYANCLEIQDGKLTINIQKFKDIEKQAYLNEVANNNLAISQWQVVAANQAMSNLDYSEASKNIDELEKKNLALYDTIDSIQNQKYEPKETKDKNTEDTWLKSFQDKLAQQKHFLEMGKNEITNEAYTEKDYLDWLDANYKFYFSNLTKYQDEYNQYEEEVYNGRKELKEKEIEDQKKAVENEIEYLNNLKTAYTDKIKDYKEELLKPINDRIEALKNENSEIEKTNELIEAQKALEESLQRKNFVYRKGAGFVYEQDQNAIKEAKDNLAKVERNNEIDSLEKQKTDIDTSMDNTLNSIENFFDSATEILQNNIYGETSPKNNPDVWNRLQYTPITLDTIKDFNISDEAKKLFSLDFGKTLNSLSNVNLDSVKKITDLMNGINTPVTNNNNSIVINKDAINIIIQGNASSDTVSQIRKIVDDEFADLANRIQTGSIQNRYK